MTCAHDSRVIFILKRRGSEIDKTDVRRMQYPLGFWRRVALARRNSSAVANVKQPKVKEQIPCRGRGRALFCDHCEQEGYFPASDPYGLDEDHAKLEREGIISIKVYRLRIELTSNTGEKLFCERLYMLSREWREFVFLEEIVYTHA